MEKELRPWVVLLAFGLILNGANIILNPPVKADGSSPFDWVESTGYGTASYWRTNFTYWRQWLRDQFEWRLTASGNGVNWYPANELMRLSMAYNVSDLSAKLTLTLDTHGAPSALYYRFTLGCNSSLLSYVNLSLNDTMVYLTLPVGGLSYSLYFNWSDIRDLIDNNQIFVRHGVQNNIFWFRIQSVNKIPKDSVFVLDPKYGDATPAAVDTFEYDEEESEHYGYHDTVRVNTSEYYLTVGDGDSGSDTDGWAKTLKVDNDNAEIQGTVVSTFEYDNSDGRYATVCHMPNTDKYVVAYRDAAVTKGTIVVLQVWDTNGTIKPSVIDSVVMQQDYYQFTIQHLYTCVYAVVCTENPSVDGWIETYWIDTNGDINATYLDNQEFDTTYGREPNSCIIDSNTIAITYCDTSATGNFQVSTWNISTGGIITGTRADAWVYEANPSYYSVIDKIGVNTYQICYVDSTADLQIDTVAISDGGMITKSWVDSLELVGGLGTAAISYPQTFIIHDPQISADNIGIYGITFLGMASGENDGYMYTWNVSDTGAIDAAAIDSYEFETGTNSIYAPCIWVNQSFYFICFSGAGVDGFAITLFITTNWHTPAVSGVYPANYAVDIPIQPVCTVTVNDLNGDNMTITFEAYIGTGYETKQVNHSTNATIRWKYLDADTGSTLYTWRFSVYDGYHNMSYVYVFTTESVGGTVLLSGEYPVNLSTFYYQCPLVISRNNSFNISITRNNTIGLNMNTKIWFDGFLVFSDTGTGNITFNVDVLENWTDGSLVNNTVYDWTVNASVGTSDVYANETYNFTFITNCSSCAGGATTVYVPVGSGGDRLGMGLVLGLFCAVPLGLMFLFRRRRKN